MCIISEYFFVSHLIGTLTDFTETVVTVLHGAAITVRGPADLAGEGEFTALPYAVRKATTGDTSPAVHIIGNGIPVAVHDANDLPVLFPKVSFCITDRFCRL